MQVFHNEEHRLTLGQFQEDRDNSFQRFLALTLWRHIEQRVAVLREGKRK
jgi:hypothetical protein